MRTAESNIKIIGFLCVGLTVFSCNSNRLEKQLVDFIGTEITIPENLQANIQGTDTLVKLTEESMKLIVWYDSVGCASCQIKQLHEWDEIVSYTVNGIAFDKVFILSPKTNDLQNISIALRTTKFNHPIYIDKSNSFYKKNPSIPDTKTMHTFLLDPNNKVILAGSPLYNNKLWELYKEQISTRGKR